MTREKAIEWFLNSPFYHKEHVPFEMAIEALKAEPVKHGHWLKTGQSFVNPNKFRNYFCSECGLELDEHIRSKPNYCPNCGAKMDEVVNE